MWFKESKRYFREIGYFAYGEVNEQGFSNPHPSGVSQFQEGLLLSNLSIKMIIATQVILLTKIAQYLI